METVENGQTVYIRPRWGFWNTTHYPYKGCFQRNGWAYMPVTVLRNQLDRLPHEVEVRLANDETAIVRKDGLRAQPEETH